MEQIKKILTESFDAKPMMPRDIPAIDLYNDQIISLFEDKMESARRRDSDKILTKAMINNYSKEKLIRPIKGKKYEREQLLQLLLIYRLKNILSIQDIKAVTGSLMQKETTPQQWEKVFITSEQMGEEISPNLEGLLGCLVGQMEGRGDNTELAALILTLSELSAQLKRAAETIIDTCFTKDTKK